MEFGNVQNITHHIEKASIEISASSKNPANRVRENKYHVSMLHKIKQYTHLGVCFKIRWKFVD